MLAACLVVCSCAIAAAEPVLRAQDHLVICDDGTSGGYSVYLEEYLLMAQHVDDLDVAHVGWWGADGFSIEKDVAPYKPTVATLLLGGGPGSGAISDAAATSLRTTYSAAIAALKSAGVRTVVVGSPPCADPHNDYCAAVAKIVKEVAAKDSALYADVYGVTADSRAKAQAHTPNYPFDNDLRNVAVMHAFLKALNCSGQIGAITIDIAAQTATGSPGHEVKACHDWTAFVEGSVYPFMFPGYPTGQLSTDLHALEALPFTNEMNRLTLVAKHLPTARTKVFWGHDGYHFTDPSIDFASADLEKGVNLMALDGTFRQLGEGVQAAVWDQQQQDERAAMANLHGKPDPAALAAHEAAIKVVRSRCGHVNPYSITLQPLSEPEKPPKSGKVPVIVDTDIDGDVDDVGALALLNSFMCQGEANLIACVTDTINAERSSGAAIKAINTYYGHGDVPIGSWQGDPAPKSMKSILKPVPPGGYHGESNPVGSRYTAALHKRFCPDFPHDDALPVGVDVYRKALAAASDHSVVICSIGQMQNLQDLVLSQPDDVSPLDGVQLVQKKVRLMVVMANTVPQDVVVLGLWPTRIVWTTFIGTFIGVGEELEATPEDNPVREAYRLNGFDPQHPAHVSGRQTWDLDAAWIAVRGNEPLFDLTPGSWRVEQPPGAYGTWVYDAKGRDALAIFSMNVDEVRKRFAAELVRPPR